MKIIVTDGYVENPGDLSWEDLAREGQLTVHDRTPPESLVASPRCLCGRRRCHL